MQSFVDRLDHPVYVVTAAADGERAGCLVSFASQCSIKPARFMVWLSTLNRTFRVARSAERLAVHLLGRDQYALAELFGGETGDRVDKFARAAWTPGPGGVPVLDDTLAWFVGRVEGQVETGDHIGFLLSSVAGETRGRPEQELLRLSDVADIPAGHPVT
ncbi:flavin reductase [Streptomyces sp. HC44]|uniref:Flavin reductase n=2 Tax=Streptomyces scabichelini TaxID=2711217 RepID=A0A6G4UWS7_9ACTN|nr:flavin reductase family protein [Streptomyces scabichelini]NGO06211.1 flavin reductase [Streptomyces scabichelini]